MVEWLFMIRELERDRGPPIQSLENVMTSLTILGLSCSLLSEARAVSSSPAMAGGGAVENVTGCPRPCYDEGVKGLVWHCRFHPTKPKLACALDKGRVCVFYARSPSMPFSEWEKLQFYTESTSLVLSIDWNVSICYFNNFRLKIPVHLHWSSSAWNLWWQCNFVANVVGPLGEKFKQNDGDYRVNLLTGGRN